MRDDISPEKLENRAQASRFSSVSTFLCPGSSLHNFNFKESSPKFDKVSVLE